MEKKEISKKSRKKKVKKKKRPIGRPKKRGPKRKYRKKKKILKKRGRKALPPFSYKIVSCKNGKQNKLVGKYRDIKDAYDVFEKLKEENKKIVFPMSFTGCEELKNSIDEYILISNDENKESSMLRNEYGVLVEHKTNSDGWIILDKFRYLREETFWVWGYSNKRDRKTFMWVFENCIVDGFNNAFEYKRVCTYKNKVVIKSDDGYMDIVFCKSPEDAIRFYNLLEFYSKKNKIKRLLFIGDFSKMSKQRKKLEDELVDFTGLSKYKIRMKNTSFFVKNK